MPSSPTILEQMGTLPPDHLRRLVEAEDPVRYLSGLQIVHPVKGRVPWQLYPYQAALLRGGPRHRIVVKARECGISQTIAGEALYLAKYHPERDIVVISRNGAEAKKLVTYCRVLASTDQDLGDLEGTQELRVPSFGRDLFPAKTDTGSPLYGKIIAEAASQSAGRGGGKLAVYIDEFAHGNFRVWGQLIYQSVMPGVTLGGRISFISTPRGKANMFYRIYREALAGIRPFDITTIPWYMCPSFNPKGFHLEDPEASRLIGEKGEWFQQTRPDYSDQEWAEEYGCDFAASAGLIYPEFDESVHVGRYKYNPDWATYAGQDFGFTHPAVALIIQVSPSEDMFVLKERYDTGRSVPDLTQKFYLPFQTKYKTRRWYCDCTSPQDIAEMRKLQLRSEGVRKHEVRNGWNAVRKLLRPPLGTKPKLHIDASCIRLITDMTTYSFKPDTEEPDKDIADHGPDALRYFVMGFKGRSTTSDVPVAGSYISASPVAEFTHS